MAKYLEAMAHSLVRGRCILEIGSGTGLCGMVAGTLKAKAVVLTDKDCAMPLLQKNLFENFYKFYQIKEPVKEHKDDEETAAVPPLVLSHALTWGQQEQTEALCRFLKVHCGAFESMIDYIVISDCICWNALHLPLIKTLEALVAFVTTNNSSGQVPTLLMSYEIRKDDCEQGFFQLIAQRKWKYERVELKHVQGFDPMFVCPELPVYAIKPLVAPSEDSQ